MRVVIAPDKFAGTLTANQAAAAIARGWSSRAPHDHLDLAPMSDGGPGFVDCLEASIGGVFQQAEVTGPYGEQVTAKFLVKDQTAYLESAQAIGLHLTDLREPEQATSYGLGESIRAAIGAGVSRIVIGVGGTATNDGGAGLLASLGATCAAGSMTTGTQGLATVTRVDLRPVLDAMRGVELVLASDVDSQLSGLFGATKTFGPQKGLAEERLPAVDGVLQQWGDLLDRSTAAAKGAGAGGGVGFALLLIGAQRVSGVMTIADAIDLSQRLKGADLVITGEGSFDFSSRAGKVPHGVAELAGQALLPCIVMAGQVVIGSREMRALGVEAAYSMIDLVGETNSYGQAGPSLEQLAHRVARNWSR